MVGGEQPGKKAFFHLSPGERQQHPEKNNTGRPSDHLLYTDPHFVRAVIKQGSVIQRIQLKQKRRNEKYQAGHDNHNDDS